MRSQQEIEEKLKAIETYFESISRSGASALERLRKVSSQLETEPDKAKRAELLESLENAGTASTEAARYSVACKASIDALRWVLENSASEG